MMLELRPLETPHQYSEKWDAYGLYRDDEWLHFADINSNTNYAYERLMCWNFLKSDTFGDRGESNLKEDLIHDGGNQFVVFLLSHNADRERKSILVPVLDLPI